MEPPSSRGPDQHAFFSCSNFAILLKRIMMHMSSTNNDQINIVLCNFGYRFWTLDWDGKCTLNPSSSIHWKQWWPTDDQSMPYGLQSCQTYTDFSHNFAFWQTGATSQSFPIFARQGQGCSMHWLDDLTMERARALATLTHLSLVPHICVSELGHHWFR